MTSVLVNTETGQLMNILTEGEIHMPISVVYPFRLVNAPDDVNRFWEYDPETISIFKPNNYLARIKAYMLQELANFRWQQEIVGIPYHGLIIATDRSSQAMISGAYAFAARKKAANQPHSFNWKLANGTWTTFTVDEVIEIADLVATHIQACFNKEKLLAQMIIDATVDIDIMNFDFAEHW